jgi:hypothetical protein
MRFHRSSLRTAAILLGSWLMLPGSFARAADPREELDKAQDYFLVADFQTALVKADELLASNELQGATLRETWVLKGRCEIALGQRANATEAFCSALRVEPSWRPDPNLFTKDESEVFANALADCGAVKPEPMPSPQPSPMPEPISAGEKPWYKKPVVLVVGSALVAGGIYALVDDGDEVTTPADVPDFPDPPQ